MTQVTDLKVGDVYSWGTHEEWYVVTQRVDALDGGTPTLRARHVGAPGDQPAPGHGFAVTVASNQTVRDGHKPPDTSGEVARAVREERMRLTREFEAWKEEATRIAHEYADRNDLCSEFDRAMEEIGLPSRERDFRVEFVVHVTARDDDAALEQAAEMIRFDESSYVADVEEV